MSDVKKRLKDIINSTFGVHSSQEFTLDNLNKNAYSPKMGHNSLDISIDKFRGKISRKTSFNSLDYSPRKSSRVSSPVRSISNFHNHQRKHDLELISSPCDTPLYFTRYSTDKIKREINEVTKLISGEEMRTRYRNRPPVDLNKPHMEFDSRSYFAMSPTSTRRTFLTTSNVFKNLSKKKHIINFDEYLGKYNFTHKENDFESFSKELMPKKKNLSVFERFPINWRFKGSFN